VKLGNIYYISKKISDLAGESVMNSMSIEQLRRNADILIIDDEEFTYLDAMRKHKFSVEHKKDIESMNDLQPYDIVLCDIRGVGKFLDSEFEGAYLISQAKKIYPNKQIIAYTASNFDPTYNSYTSVADAYITKGTSIEDWISLLDDRLKACVDPIAQWNKLRTDFLETGMNTVDVAYIEQLYVDAVKKGDFDAFENPDKLKVSLNRDARDVIAKFMSSLFIKLIVKAITGGMA